MNAIKFFISFALVVACIFSTQADESAKREKRLVSLYGAGLYGAGLYGGGLGYSSLGYGLGAYPAVAPSLYHAPIAPAIAPAIAPSFYHAPIAPAIAPAIAPSLYHAPIAPAIVSPYLK